MAEFCSCGAQLPPDAVFCHKCGKPQREVAAVEPEALPPPPPPLVAPQIPEAGPAVVGFRNRDALRIALQVAAMATVLFFFFFLSWTAAGTLAVFLYRRRTGRAIDTGACLRLGWLTGLMIFAIPAALFTGWFVLLQASGQTGIFQAMVQNTQDPQVKKAIEGLQGILQSPIRLAGTYLQYFISMTFFSMMGGLLGALIIKRMSPPPRGGNTV